MLPLFLAPRNTRLPLGRRIGGLLAVILIHVAVAYALLQVESVRQAVTDAMPIMVEFITPPEPEVRPKELPRPLPMAHAKETPRSPDPPPLLTTDAKNSAPSWTTSPQPAPQVAREATPLVVTGPDFNADYLHNPRPAYPGQARRRGEQGKVLLRVYVSTDGMADKVEIQSSSGYALLDEAAVTAVRAWRFVPARQGNIPVAAWVAVPIIFRLEG